MGGTSLKLYKNSRLSTAARPLWAPPEPEVPTAVKSTLMFRQIANPRRTTLAHLTDATELTAAGKAAEDAAQPATESGAEGRQLPERTANPRRTVLTELPEAHPAP